MSTTASSVLMSNGVGSQFFSRSGLRPWNSPQSTSTRAPAGFEQKLRAGDGAGGAVKRDANHPRLEAKDLRGLSSPATRWNAERIQDTGKETSPNGENPRGDRNPAGSRAIGRSATTAAGSVRIQTPF